MRTAINIDEHLLGEAREVSHRTNRSSSEIVGEGVRLYLRQRSRRKPARRVELVTFGEGGLQPGIDLDDSATLLGLMEAGRATGGYSAPSAAPWNSRAT